MNLTPFDSIKLDKTSQEPLTNQLTRRLTWMIADGVVNEGEKLPPVRELSEILGIHYHTIRASYHQLEDRGLVSIRPNIGTVVLAYVPFSSAKSRDSQDRGLVAILLPSLSEFYQHIIQGMEAVAQKHRITPLVRVCGEDPLYAEKIYKQLSAKGFSGFINISLGFSDEFYSSFQKSQNLDVPLVFLDSQEANTHTVSIDTSAGICLATEHLLSHGYDSIGLINCPEPWPIGREAVKGLDQALKNSDVDRDRVRIFNVPGFTFDAGRYIAEHLLKEGPLPRALVAVSDNLAIGMMTELINHGIRVPDDVAIMGYNDTLQSTIFNPPLSTIALPLYEMGTKTMEALLSVMKGGKKSWIKEVFTGHLVKRTSCGCLPAGGSDEKN